MKTKKVILFIVEGVTDKTSLGGIIDKLVSSSLVRFYITGGDITSDRYSNSANAIKKVNEHIKSFLTKELGINKKDIIQIVHLIDTDGAYIEEDKIKTGEVQEFLYSETEIIANSVERVVERNNRKQQVINRLSLCPKISGIPYSMYYFSCNLEHVLHNEINLADDLKIEYAEKFADSYYKVESKFIDFIQEEELAVKGDYKKTWEFIKLNGNSLKRYSNFHIFFEQSNEN
jgi:hypothetical protein